MYLTARSLMRRLCLLLLATSGSVTAAYAGNDSWTSIGPTGGRVLALAGDPSNANVVYVATGVGVFKSTNGGASWTPINNGFEDRGGDLRWGGEGLAIDPTNANIVYATTAYGIFKSTNGGAIWTKVPGLKSPIYVLAIDPSDTDTLYAGVLRGISKSDDGGATWTPKNAGLVGLEHLRISDIALDPTDGKIVYAATNCGIFKSTNGGSSWYSVNTGLIDARMPSQSLVSSLAIDPSNHVLIYAGTHSGLFKSTNGGGSWNQIGTERFPIHAISIERSKNGVIYAGTDFGFLISTDKGDSWTRTNGPFSHVFSIHVKSSGAFYVGTLNGVFKTVDRGGSWTSLNAGVNSTGITAIAIDPSNPRIIYAGSDGQGVFKTVDGGVSWTLAPRLGISADGLARANGWLKVSSLAIDPANSRIIYAGHNVGISKSTDGGATWNLVNDRVADLSILSLAINPTDTNIVYAGSPYQIIIKSTNGGANWASASNGMTGRYIASLQIDPSETNTIYAAATQGGVFKSINGGASWAEINAGIEPFDPHGNTNKVQFLTRAIAIDPSHTSTVYAAGLVGVFKSTNGGADWARAGASTMREYVHALAVDPYNSNTIYAGCCHYGDPGVFRSLDGGQTWTEFNAGLTTRNVVSIAINPSRTSTIYVGTLRAGIFRCGSKMPDAPAAESDSTVGELRASGNSARRLVPSEINDTKKNSDPGRITRRQIAVNVPNSTPNSLVLRDGEIIVVRYEGKYAAVKAVEQVAKQKGSFIRYIWWYQPDGSGSFTNKNALNGSGEAREDPGEYPCLKVGPLLVGWSIGAARQGYVYFRHPVTFDIVYGLVLTKKTDIGDLDAKREFQRVE